MLGASPQYGRKTPSIPLSFLTGIQLKIKHGFSGGVGCSTTLWWFETSCISAHPGTPFVASNQTFTLNKTFISWMLILTRGWLLVALGILVLVYLFEKRLNWPGTDECYQMVQHSSTMGSINMQWHQLQGSSQQTKDNNTDIFCNNSHKMLLHGVELLKSL